MHWRPGKETEVEDDGGGDSTDQSAETLQDEASQRGHGEPCGADSRWGPVGAASMDLSQRKVPDLTLEVVERQASQQRIIGMKQV